MPEYGILYDFTHHHAVDGREIVPMKEAQIVEQCEIIKAKGLKNVSHIERILLAALLTMT